MENHWFAKRSNNSQVTPQQHIRKSWRCSSKFLSSNRLVVSTHLTNICCINLDHLPQIGVNMTKFLKTHHLQTLFFLGGGMFPPRVGQVKLHNVCCLSAQKSFWIGGKPGWSRQAVVDISGGCYSQHWFPITARPPTRPLTYPSRKKAVWSGLINHWFPLIGPYCTLISEKGWLG